MPDKNIKDVFEEKWAKRPWNAPETSDKDKAFYWFNLGISVESFMNSMDSPPKTEKKS